MGITHSYMSLDMRLMRSIRFGETTRLDLIAEGFNLFNRFNEAAAAPFFTAVNEFGQRASNGRFYSRPDCLLRSETVSVWRKAEFLISALR